MHFFFQFCVLWFSKFKFLLNYHIAQNKHGFMMDHFIKIHLLKDMLSKFNLEKQLSKLRPSASLQTIFFSLTLEENIFFI